MKVKDFNLLAAFSMVVAVLILTLPSRSQELTHGDEAKSSRKKYDSGHLPALVGKGILISVLVCCCIVYIFIAVEHYFKDSSSVHCVFFLLEKNHLINDKLRFLFDLESRDQDFLIKWRGEMYSWKNLSQLLHQHNITLPQEEKVFSAVLQQKNSSAQSCKGRCFLNERRHPNMACFCDKPCKLLSDCCLDFQTR